MKSRTPITSEGLLKLGFETDSDLDREYYVLSISKFDCAGELKPFNRVNYEVNRKGETIEKIELDIDMYEFDTSNYLDDNEDINSVYLYVRDLNIPMLRLMYIEQIIEMYKFLTGEDLV